MKYLPLIMSLGLGCSIIVQAEETARPSTSINEELVLDSAPLVKVVKEQLFLLKEQDVDRAYNDYTSESFKKNTSLENFNAFLKHFDILSNDEPFRLHSVYTEDNITTLQGALITNVNEYQLEYDLIKENGLWKIEGITLLEPEIIMGNTDE